MRKADFRLGDLVGFSYDNGKTFLTVGVVTDKKPPPSVPTNEMVAGNIMVIMNLEDTEFPVGKLNYCYDHWRLIYRPVRA
jgi:hypothetical protein